MPLAQIDARGRHKMERGSDGDYLRKVIANGLRDPAKERADRIRELKLAVVGALVTAVLVAIVMLAMP